MKVKTRNKKREEALDAVAAWRTLYYAGLINDKESESITNRINKKYNKYLFPVKP